MQEVDLTSQGQVSARQGREPKAAKKKRKKRVTGEEIRGEGCSDPTMISKQFETRGDARHEVGGDSQGLDQTSLGLEPEI